MDRPNIKLLEENFKNLNILLDETINNFNNVITDIKKDNILYNKCKNMVSLK